MLTYYQESKNKGNILYFNFSRVGKMLRLCSRNHKTLFYRIYTSENRLLTIKGLKVQQGI